MTHAREVPTMGNETQAKKATPPGWPRISSSIFYDYPPAAIDCLRDAYAFHLLLKL